MRRLAGAVREDDAMLEEELDAARDRVIRAVAREPEDRAPALVERRVRALAMTVAVPAAVGPLRLDERLRERVEPRVSTQPDVETCLERAALLRRMAAHAAVDAAAA